MDRRLKIAFLTNFLQPAGAETFILNHVRHLDPTRYEPVVCQMKQGGELLDSFKAIGVEVISLNKKGRLDLRALWRLYRLLRDRRIDILQTHVFYASIVGRIVGRLARVPVIVSTEQDVRMGAQAKRPLNRLLNDLTMVLFAHANVYITEGVASSFSKTLARSVLGNRQIERVIPNGIEVDLNDDQTLVNRDQMRAKLGLAPEHFVIGNVGRLDYQKGQSYLIDAFAQVRAALPQARLVIVGWGDLQDDLKSQAARLGISHEVHFLGKRSDVLKLLACFDLFAFPSVYEAQGVAILEAMAAGVPVVASEVGGIPEMVRHELTGLLVAPHSADAIASSILRLYRDRELAQTLAHNAGGMVRAEYSMEHVSSEYEKLYLELVGLNSAHLASQ